MSFRKRNVALADAKGSSQSNEPTSSQRVRPSGTRPSTVDGRIVTSSGTSTLDNLFAGHGGLPLGTSLLLQESGTTDYAGALLRLYAAEGLMQGHQVHVVGLPEQWGRELPGIAADVPRKSEAQQEDRMKIAWRYQGLGQFESAAAGKGQSDASRPFCHVFDLTKRLTHPAGSHSNYIRIDNSLARSPFDTVVAKLESLLSSSNPTSIHRVVVPSLMSPALYPAHACFPQNVLRFQHALRQLLHKYPQRITIMQTLPLSLHPRQSGIIKWIETFCDGVFELVPFPHSADAEFASSRDPTTKEEPPQGILRIHKLPLFHEQAIGVPPSELDWTFVLSRRKFTVKPFNLPPIGGDTDAQQTGSKDEKPKKENMEF